MLEAAASTASVALGAALGGMARYALVVSIESRRRNPRWPIGTLVVNLLGCLLLGLVVSSAGLAAQETLQRGLVAALGSFTTVSAFVLESWQRRARRRTWIGYGVVTVVGCLAMFGLGQSLP